MSDTSTPPAPEAPWQPETRYSADGNVALYGYKQPPAVPLSPPRIVALTPLTLRLEPKRYSWCSCGHSKNQPFCDDSHRLPENNTNRKSYKFEVLAASTIQFCMCRFTGDPPYCDGTCAAIRAASGNAEKLRRLRRVASMIRRNDE